MKRSPGIARCPVGVYPSVKYNTLPDYMCVRSGLVVLDETMTLVAIGLEASGGADLAQLDECYHGRT